MKKIFLSIAALTVLFFSFTNGASAQAAATATAGASAVSHDIFSNAIHTTSAADAATGSVLWPIKKNSTQARAQKASLRAAKGYAKAQEHFAKQFKNMSPSKWVSYNDVIVAYCSEDSVNSSITYKKNGRLLHSLTYYSGTKMPQDICAIAEQSFPGTKAFVVTKVNESSLKFYVVNLEDAHTFKRVIVYNNEVTLLDDLTKSK